MSFFFCCLWCVAASAWLYHLSVCLYVVLFEACCCVTCCNVLNPVAGSCRAHLRVGRPVCLSAWLCQVSPSQELFTAVVDAALLLGGDVDVAGLVTRLHAAVVSWGSPAAVASYLHTEAAVTTRLRAFGTVGIGSAVWIVWREYRAFHTQGASVVRLFSSSSMCHPGVLHRITWRCQPVLAPTWHFEHVLLVL